jgi:hypothetical protein
MTDSVKQVWVVKPIDARDLAPLPALVKDSAVAIYDRREGKFGPFTWVNLPFYATFDECRVAMVEQLIKDLTAAREAAREIAATIEHVKTIPATPFPSDVTREVPEAQQQEAQGQEEASAEEVKPAKTELKRPRRS